MPRKGRVGRRQIAPDPTYKSELAGRFINKLMLDGKKATAQRVFYDSMNLVAERSQKNALEVFEAAVRNASPALEVRPRRVGGTTYQVPMEVRPERRLALALRWLTTYSRQRSERTMAERLAGEILDASNNAGASVRRREEMHRMAEANRAFAHYRW